ncbi:AMP-binding protein [Kibdelosporangium philippinense]|uniref:AMP-binding protein n=1 Tax=Kibdelosporangium philippinense TaxID=211113 RepID=A0ABS8ZU64_9PSEU|nr:AMP-binding protein [Kibdelosporangium philippinense]MCE7011285.1 AMP-binding protein [Kibdelosporangium philippinense]
MIARIRANEELSRRYRASGIWRRHGPLADLRKWRAETPHAAAIIAEEAGVSRVCLTYAEYERMVERFAGALTDLGIGRGDVVLIQLPSRWQVPALMLACLRVGAIVAPVIPTIRPREVERMLRRLEVRVCVTIDCWEGFAHADALAEMSDRLPHLQHRVILGHARDDRGELSFDEVFERSATCADELDDDPDRAAMVLFTSGTTGAPKGVVHTANTLYAGIAPVIDAEQLGQHDRFFTAAALTHIVGAIYGYLLPLLTGGTAVIRDAWDPVNAAILLAETQATVYSGAPVFLRQLLSAIDTDSSGPLALRLVVSGATTIPRRLVDQTHRILGLPLRTAWGMTEAAGHTWTRRDDPVDWGAYSDGSPGAGVEIDLRSQLEITREQPGRLFVRGAGVCVATFGLDSDESRILADHDDGWYDTGDLAVHDGRGGIRLMGRVTDRIGGTFMIPVTDVEAALLNHPGIADVALVGYPDGDGGELACAYVVATPTATVDLPMIRAYLNGIAMTGWYQPSRVEVIGQLPRNGSGKVQKDVLRARLLDSQ